MPFGIQVQKYAFPEDSSSRLRSVGSGKLVGRRLGAHQWEPVVNSLTTQLNTTLDGAAAAGVTKLKLKSVSGYKTGDAIAIGSTTGTINNVDLDTHTITLTAGLPAAQADGAVVRLSAAVNYDEIYILAFDIQDANYNPDGELFMHHKPVKVNFLPDYANFSAAVLTKVRELYQCYEGV